MHEEEQSLAGYEEHFTLRAAIDVAALAVKGGPVVLCSYIHLFFQEIKRLKAQIKLLEKDLRNAQEIISLHKNIDCHCQHAQHRKPVHHNPNSENNDEFIQAQNISTKRSLKREDYQQAMIESNQKLSKMNNSFGGDSGIQLSLSHSLGDLLPHFPNAESYSEFRRTSGRFSSRSSNSHRSSLFRRNSETGKSSGTSYRNSVRAVQLKSVHRKTSLDTFSDDTIPGSNSQTNTSGSLTSKPTLREACVREEATATTNHAPAAGALCAMTVVAQVHQSANYEEIPESQIGEVTEGFIETESDSMEELDLESACPLFGCLCKACSELQLLDPGIMYYIDECGGRVLTVGTELLVSKEGDDQQTVTVSVLYLGHAPQTLLPSGYTEAELRVTFPVGVMALFPDGQEAFVPLSNVLYVVSYGSEQSDQYQHISEVQVEQSDQYQHISEDQVEQSDEYQHISEDQVEQSDQYQHISEDQVEQSDEYQHISEDQVEQSDEYQHISVNQVEQSDQYQHISEDQVEQSDEYQHISEDQVEDICETKLDFNSLDINDQLQEGTHLECGAEIKSLQNHGNSMIQQNNEKAAVSQKNLESRSYDCKVIYESETCPKNISVCGVEYLSLCDNEIASRSNITSFSNELYDAEYSKGFLANDIHEKSQGNFDNAEGKITENANSPQITCFKPLPVDSNLRTFISHPVVSENVEGLSMDDSQTYDYNSVIAAVNPRFSAVPATASQFLSSNKPVLLFDSRGSLKQFNERACTFNANLDGDSSAHDATSHISNSCKSFYRHTHEDLSTCQTCSGSSCTCSNGGSKECKCMFCCTCSKCKCSCYKSCTNYNKIKVSARGGCESSSQRKCFGSHECSPAISCKDCEVSMVDCEQTVDSHHGSDSQRLFWNDCFEPDAVVKSLGFNTLDMGESPSDRSSSMSGSLKDSFCLKSSYSYGLSGINTEKQSPGNEKVYSESIPSSDTCFRKLPDFNSTPLSLHVRCFSASLAEDDTSESDSGSKRRSDSMTSLDSSALNASAAGNRRAQMSSVDKVYSLSDRDVRISIRSASPEKVSRVPKDDIFNRALRVLRRCNSPVVESIDLTDVSHV
ncbi:hypothetical protein FHG87_015529 [Trinorchestia longiramus]|nr:hypothetical protein FHG87_015529 [Trinorchestia longiramus]